MGRVDGGGGFAADAEIEMVMPQYGIEEVLALENTANGPALAEGHSSIAPGNSRAGNTFTAACAESSRFRNRNCTNNHTEPNTQKSQYKPMRLRC